MEATATRATRRSRRGDIAASELAQKDVATVFERYSADVYEVVRGLVDDPEKANRIAQAAFIASCQALAASADPRRNETNGPTVGGMERATAASSPSGQAPTTSGACPKLGYADNAAEHYSRPTQLHRCFASGGIGARLSTREQTELCLTSTFAACPRLGVATRSSEPPTVADSSLENGSPPEKRPRPRPMRDGIIRLGPASQQPEGAGPAEPSAHGSPATRDAKESSAVPAARTRLTVEVSAAPGASPAPDAAPPAGDESAAPSEAAAPVRRRRAARSSSPPRASLTNEAPPATLGNPSREGPDAPTASAAAPTAWGNATTTPDPPPSAAVPDHRLEAVTSALRKPAAPPWRRIAATSAPPSGAQTPDARPEAVTASLPPSAGAPGEQLEADALAQLKRAAPGTGASRKARQRKQPTSTAPAPPRPSFASRVRVEIATLAAGFTRAASDAGRRQAGARQYAAVAGTTIALGAAATLLVTMALASLDDSGAAAAEADVARIVSAASAQAGGSAPGRAPSPAASSAEERGAPRPGDGEPVASATGNAAEARALATSAAAVGATPALASTAAGVGATPALTTLTAAGVGATPGRTPGPTAVVTPTAEVAVKGRVSLAPGGVNSVNLRERPTTSARSLGMLRNGTPLDVFSETARADGFGWARVQTADGLSGWVVSTALRT